MKKSKNNKKHILLRYVNIIICVLIFSAMIVGTLGRTIIWQGKRWNAKADSLLTNTAEIIPHRGTLYADDGTVLATSLNLFEARLDFRNEGTNLDTLAKYLPALCDSLAVFDRGRSDRTSDEWKKRFLEEMNKDFSKRSRAFLLFRQLSHQDLQKLRTFPFLKMSRGKTGFTASSFNKRAKPYGRMASRSIGTAAERSDIAGVHGISGLEKSLDSLLYGIPGVAAKTQTNNGINQHVQKEATPGWNITTTINVAIQDIVEQELYNKIVETNARWGCAVVMEVATGEIKAISNFDWNPTYQDYLETLNHAVMGYEPGSVMKPISMMVALNNGTVNNIDARLPTGRQFSYCGTRISDPHGAGALSPREIIATSSNIGMSKLTIAKYEHEPDQFRQTLEEMGFFEKFNTGIAGECTPYFPKLGKLPRHRAALTRMAFGYTTQIPPIYTLAMYNAIANDGKMVRPHLVKKLSRKDCPDSIVPMTYVNENLTTPENAAKLRQMLHDVVWMDQPCHGTARALKNDLVEIAGKTGTCFEVEDGHYTAHKRLAFCGFFPYEKPKYSCIVLMCRANCGAALSSGTVLKNIALKMYARGMLGDNSDFRTSATTESTDRVATVYPSASGRNKAIREKLGNCKTFKRSGSNPQKGMPNVECMSLRDALEILEKQKQLSVNVVGTGFVAKQSIAAGSPCKPGDKVTLYLKH